MLGMILFHPPNYIFQTYSSTSYGTRLWRLVPWEARALDTVEVDTPWWDERLSKEKERATLPSLMIPSAMSWPHQRPSILTSCSWVSRATWLIVLFVSYRAQGFRQEQQKCARTMASCLLRYYF